MLSLQDHRTGQMHQTPIPQVHNVVIHIFHKQFLKERASTIFIFKPSDFSSTLGFARKGFIKKGDGC